MSLTIRKPGIFTTVQDRGRFGSRALGVNPTGAMDVAAMRALNIVVGNNENAAVLEMHFPAAELEFENPTSFAVGGADFGAEIDGVPWRNWSTAFADKGSNLRFRKRSVGQRAYLAVAGGIDVPNWLGSSSTNTTAEVGGYQGRKLAAGDRLDISENKGHLASEQMIVGQSLWGRHYIGEPVRVVAGHEFDVLTATSERSLLTETFTVTRDSNRMGYRLAGPALHLLHEYEMISSAVSFGTIQLLPDGQLIVLMADHQTSGGYPRIGHVISVDLPILSQSGAGDHLRFKMISVDEAEDAAMQFENELNFLRLGCRLQTQNAYG